MLTLKVTCPACGRHLQVPDESLVGRKVKCRQCRKPFVVTPEQIVREGKGTDETFVGSVGGSTFAAGSVLDDVPSLPAESASDSATLVGERRTLGQYILLEPLGQGSMGTVFKALHRRLQKLVAVKVLVEELTADPRALARFEREMLAVGQLSHPNILQALDAGEADGVHYLVTEFLDGMDLRKRVNSRGPMLIHEACELVRLAALALDHAHPRELVHRDVKPSNLFVMHDGQVKLLDLGLARRPDDRPASGQITAHGQCVGTPDYMAPEQWTDPQNVDGRSDLYGLACTLFFALAGRAPFAGETGESITRKMIAHLHGPVPEIRSVRPEVPAELSALIRRTLSKNPDHRPATGKEFAALLEPFTAPPKVEELVEFQLVSKPVEPARKPVVFEVVAPPPAVPSAVVPGPAAGEAPGLPQVESSRTPVPEPRRNPVGDSTVLWAIAGLSITAILLIGVIVWLCLR